MIVNPGKFQEMVINRFGKMENRHQTYIDDKKLASELSVKLRGIEMDNQLKCDSNVPTQYQKTRSKLNAIVRLGKCFGKYFCRSLCIFKFEIMSFTLPIYLHDIYKQSGIDTKKSPSTAI